MLNSFTKRHRHFLTATSLIKLETVTFIKQTVLQNAIEVFCFKSRDLVQRISCSVFPLWWVVRLMKAIVSCDTTQVVLRSRVNVTFFKCHTAAYFLRDPHTVSKAENSLRAISVHLYVLSFSRDCAAIYRWPYGLHVLSYNSTTADRIFLKFRVKVMPLETTPESYLLVS